MQLLFTAPASVFDSKFWRKLWDFKVNNGLVKCQAITYRQSGPSTIVFDEESFDLLPNENVRHPATLLFVESLDEFKAIDKNRLLADYSEPTWERVCAHAGEGEGDCSSSLEIWPIFILVFAGLKTNQFYHWMGTPTFLPSEALNVEMHPLSDKMVESLDASWPPSMHSIGDKNVWVCVDVLSTATAHYSEKIAATQVLLGWRLRNWLASRLVREKSVDVVVIRDGGLGSRGRNMFLTVCSSELFVKFPNIPLVTGWELNEDGKPGARVFDLSKSLDPQVVAAQAARLNTQLIKWRSWPDLDLTRIEKSKVLLLGAGTLGCCTARLLVGWGVSKITFVDCGKVSHSSPLRQNLFTLADAEAASFKAEAAAMRLREIVPSTLLDVQSVVLELPSPGHPTTSVNGLDQDVSTLSQLISSHDAVFSLMDSREARWLPTLLCAQQNTMLITAALGTESWLVMRSGEGLGCYFCSDVCGVANTIKGRPLDQQCTVTRVGCSSIAAALAVELFISRLHFGDDCLRVPHMIRGTLDGFEQKKNQTSSYERCVCCSHFVRSRLENHDSTCQFVRTVIANEEFLLECTGISNILGDASADDALIQEE